MESMILMLGLYKWPLLAGVLAATTLSQLGVQLATRDRAMQTMCLAQGAMFGVLLALGLLGTLETSNASSIPLAGALLFAALCFCVTEWVANKQPASKNTFFAFVFSFLLSMSHLISSMFPTLENHLAQIYFGDLATLGERESWYTGVFSVVCLAMLAQLRYFFSAGSFNHAVYGVQNQIRRGFVERNLFNSLALMTICLSVQYLGFLFTISTLFVPTAMLIFSPKKGLMSHLFRCSAVGAVSAFAGFTLSLRYTHLPTVPAIVGVMVGLLATLLVVERSKKLLARLTARYLQKKSEMVFETISDSN